MKFKYNYINDLLWKLDEWGNYLIEISHKFIAGYGARGFIIGPENHWITFKVYEREIKVFYKYVKENGEIAYYQKYIAFIPLNKMSLVVPNFAREILVEFTEADEVEKNEGGKWVYKKKEKTKIIE